MCEPQNEARESYIPTSTINLGLLAPKTTFLILASIFLSCFATLPAQSPAWFDLGDFSWTIESPSGYFDSGDTILYTLKLGAAGDSASDVLATDLLLDLADHVSIPANPSPDIAGSWLFDTANCSDCIHFDTASRELSILTERIDGVACTGMGEVYTFLLISGKDDVLATDLWSYDGGGMVLVDNVEMRLAAPASPRVVKLEHAVLNQHGVLGGWESLALPDSGGAGLNLAPGLHFLRETMADGEVRLRKVWVQ